MGDKFFIIIEGKVSVLLPKPSMTSPPNFSPRPSKEEARLFSEEDQPDIKVTVNDALSPTSSHDPPPSRGGSRAESRAGSRTGSRLGSRNSERIAVTEMPQSSNPMSTI